MGQKQSSQGAADNTQAPPAKTSYYELLGIERSVSEEEIKKAYRRKALELHPDRNFGREEEATRLFAEVQVAYEVLSDPQERSWYDSHEGAILRGDDAEDIYEHNVRVTTAEDITLMLSRFHGKVDYSDGPTGFFGYLNTTFAQLAKEEDLAADWDGLEPVDYPSFGHKDDTYDDVVKTFYSAWGSFTTQKSFSWKEKYRMSDAPDRQYRRAMERENKKARDEGIKEFNEAVRVLVAFVRKRDPRYTPNTQSDEERQKALREAAKAQAARDRAANAAKLAEQQVPEWARSQNHQSDPEQSDEWDEDEAVDEFECVACSKTFKSEKQWEAHEKSKKHRKAVQTLKWKMRKDNEKLGLDDEEENGSEAEPDLDLPTVESDLVENAASVSGEEFELIDAVDNLEIDDPEEHSKEAPISTLETKDNSEPQSASTAAAEDEEVILENDKVDDIDDDDSDGGQEPPKPISNLGDDSEDSAPTRKVGKAAQKRAKKAAKQTVADQDELKHRCGTCNAGFPSKSRLFQHISDFKDHAMPINQTKAASGGKKKGKR